MANSTEELWKTARARLSMAATEVAAIALTLSSGRARWRPTQEDLDAIQRPLAEVHLAIANIAVTNVMLAAGIDLGGADRP